MPFFERLMLALILCVIVLGAALAPAFSQDVDAVPTLVPPTPIPVVEQGIAFPQVTESTVARIQRDGLVRVGILYNEPPFGTLNVLGQVEGYDADVARALAKAWDVEVAFIQVTRQNRIEMLRSGQVDLLLAATVHRREYDAEIAFSQSYRVSRQAILVREDYDVANIINLANARIAYVMGTTPEQALNTWQDRTGVPLDLRPYLTLDQAYSALFGGEVEGVAGSQERLLRVAANDLAAIKLLDEEIAPEPYGIGLLRGDYHMRMLVNRTLQYLLDEGALEALHEAYFPGDAFNVNALPLWDNLGEDAPRPSQFGTDIPAPPHRVLERLRDTGVLRVAGLPDASVDPNTLSGSQRLINQVNQAVIDQLARRWDVRVEIIAGDDPISLLESGQADVALGVEPDWALADRMDFSQPYLLHGDRLMIEKGGNIDGLSSNFLINGWVGVIETDGNAQERAQEQLDERGTRANIYITTEAGAADAMLTVNNADVIYGDSLLLLPHVRAYPEELELVKDFWYTRDYAAIGLPINDVDFRLLVNYTLQEMVRDETLRTILVPATPPEEDLPLFEYWPGSGDFLGVSFAN